MNQSIEDFKVNRMLLSGCHGISLLHLNSIWHLRMLVGQMK